MNAQTVKIITRTVGQNFGSEASVIAGRKTLHTTRVTPYGMAHVACQLAVEWATTNGYTVRSARIAGNNLEAGS